MVAMERHRLVPVVAASGLALNAASALGTLLGGLGLIGVAAGARASRSLTALALMAPALRRAAFRIGRASERAG